MSTPRERCSRGATTSPPRRAAEEQNHQAAKFDTIIEELVLPLYLYLHYRLFQLQAFSKRNDFSSHLGCCSWRGSLCNSHEASTPSPVSKCWEEINLNILRLGLYWKIPYSKHLEMGGCDSPQKVTISPLQALILDATQKYRNLRVFLLCFQIFVPNK